MFTRSKALLTAALALAAMGFWRAAPASSVSLDTLITEAQTNASRTGGTASTFAVNDRGDRLDVTVTKLDGTYRATVTVYGKSRTFTGTDAEDIVDKAEDDHNFLRDVYRWFWGVTATTNTVAASAAGLSPASKLGDLSMNRNLMRVTPRALMADLAARPTLPYLDLAYSHDKFRSDTGDTLKLALGFERSFFRRVTAGIAIPYEHTWLEGDLDTDLDRVGADVYMDFTIIGAAPRPPVRWIVGARASYLFTIMHEPTIWSNTYGPGVYTAVTADLGFVIPAVIVEYDHFFDDMDTTTRQMRYGVNLGVPLGDAIAINQYAFITQTLNEDVTGGRVYVTPGVEGSFALGEGLSFRLGFRSVLGLEDFDSFEAYLGTSWRF